MRILQIVTLISAVGAFGGPTRVAVNQCEALQARGHETLLVGGTDDLPLDTSTMGSVPIRLFPTRRLSRSKPMAYLWSPSMLAWLRTHLAEFDVVHIHLARDGITMPAAVLTDRRHLPYVTQTHGMITPRAGLPHRVIDRLATLRVLRHADTMFALSTDEIAELTSVLGESQPIKTPITLLPNGIPTPEAPDGVVAGGRPEFLFLARLHPRKRAVTFVRAAIALLSRGARAVFTLVGPDDGDGAAVTSTITDFTGAHSEHADALQWLGPLPPDETSSRMALSYVYVLPSVDEPFPMSLIEALAVGRPVVVTESNGLAEVVSRHECGLVVPDDSVEALADAMEQMLHAPDMVAEMGERAVAAVRDTFSMAAVADILEDRYLACAGARF